jgi:hypothetical protein
MDNKAYFITIYDKLRCDRVLKMDKNKPINDEEFNKMMKHCHEELQQQEKYVYLNKKIIQRP